MESPESVVGKTDIASGNHVHYVSYPRDEICRTALQRI